MELQEKAVNTKALVSIIVRTKDRPELLEEALESISLQTYRPLEVVVVNDGGVNVENILEKFESQELSIKYIHHPHSLGRAAAANAGLKRAEGVWLGFLDDDDLLLPRAVETLLLYGRAANVVYGKVELTFLKPDGLWYTLSLYGYPFSKEALFYNN